MAAIPTVLVVDDDYAVRLTMERLLRAYGYLAVTAASLDEANALLSTTKESRPLILDVKLQPGHNGLDVS